MEETCSGWKGRPLTRVTSYISLPNVTNRSHEKQNVGPARWRVTLLAGPAFLHILLFRERSSEKVHATIRNLKDWHERQWTYVCECLRKATKVGLTATVSGTVIISHINIPYYLSGLSRAHFFSGNLSPNSCKHFGSTSLSSFKARQSEHARSLLLCRAKGLPFFAYKSSVKLTGRVILFPGTFFLRINGPLVD